MFKFHGYFLFDKIHEISPLISLLPPNVFMNLAKTICFADVNEMEINFRNNIHL